MAKTTKICQYDIYEIDKNIQLKKGVSMYKDYYSKKLKKARERAGYTQKQVEDLTGITQPILSRIERGDREPSIENLCTLIDFYEVSADWILGTGVNTKHEN